MSDLDVLQKFSTDAFAPDLGGDGLVEGLAVELAILGGRDAGRDRGHAGPVLDVGPAVDDGAKAADQVQLALVGLQRLELLLHLIADALLVRHPDGRAEAAAVEVGAEAHRDRLTRRGDGLAVGVEEAV